MDEKYKFLENFEKFLKFLDKNSLEKMNFYLFLEKLLLKIEPSEITSFFYNNLFNFVGTFPVFTPWRGHCSLNFSQNWQDSAARNVFYFKATTDFIRS